MVAQRCRVAGVLRTFADGDALGDLAGLIPRLGYVTALGADAMRPAHRSEIGPVRSVAGQVQGDDRAPGPEQVLAERAHPFGHHG